MILAAREAIGTLGVAATILAAAAAIVAVAAFWSGASVPLVRLPTPTGAFFVGTSVMTLADGPAVQVWYPAADGSSGWTAPYRAEARTTLRNRLIDSFVGTNAMPDVPVAAGKYPVLVYVPAWGGTRSDNTSQAENLASHGFIVVALDDLYPTRSLDLSSAAAFTQTLRWAAEKSHLQAAAALHALTEFDALAAQPRSAFAGHVDTARAGMFGFSFGGAVAAEAARLDSRIAAAANLDGWVYGEAATEGVARPFMVISDSTADELAAAAADPHDHHYADVLDRENLKQTIDGLKRHGGYYLTVSGTGHYDFCDVAVLPSIRHTGVGAIGGRRAQSIVSTYLVQFFDRFVNGRRAPLLEAARKSRQRDAARSSIDPAAHLDIWHSPLVGLDGRAA